VRIDLICSSNTNDVHSGNTPYANANYKVILSEKGVAIHVTGDSMHGYAV
jgi:phage repressor protein C with HTH and peptisase S24 domain